MTVNHLDPISKTFFYCVSFTNWPDAVDILYLIFEVSGLVLNILTSVLLFRIRHGPKLAIVLLRTLSIHCVLVCFVNFLEDSNPNGITTDNYVFNTMVCVFWNSRFFYWIFTVAAIQCLVFLSADRVLTLHKFERLRFTGPQWRITEYQISIHAFSVIITMPQVLTVNLQDGTCGCAPTTVNIPFLSIVYAHVYLWFTFLLVIDGSVLLCCAYCIVKWVRETPKSDQFDDLSELSFEGVRERGHRSEQHIGRGYRTASMFVVPLAVSHVITFSYDSSYQFVSGLGLTTFVINSIPQKIGGLLLVLHANVVPAVLFFYLPPLREFAVKFFLSPFHVVKKSY